MKFKSEKQKKIRNLQRDMNPQEIKKLNDSKNNSLIPASFSTKNENRDSLITSKRLIDQSHNRDFNTKSNFYQSKLQSQDGVSTAPIDCSSPISQYFKIAIENYLQNKNKNKNQNYVKYTFQVIKSIN